MKKTALMLIVLLLFVAGIVWLQVFLSKAKSKILGLILPSISFMFSLITIFGMAGFGVGAGDVFVTIPTTFFITNIPTIIFITIYISSKEKIKKNKEIEKMNIQDL